MFSKPQQDSPKPQFEENKLAALNDIIKLQEMPADDEDDFETFLERLNAKRNPDFQDASP